MYDVVRMAFYPTDTLIYQLNLTMATNEKVRRLFAIMLIIVSLTTDTILVHIHPLLEKLLL